jgi:hypothetical protein
MHSVNSHFDLPGLQVCIEEKNAECDFTMYRYCNYKQSNI